MTNLVVVSSEDDHWLHAVREKLKDAAPDRPIDTQQLVEAALIRLLRQHPGTTSIELVSHAIDDINGEHENLLKFGSWVVNASSVENFGQELRALTQGRELRLVGCPTAIETPAFQAMKAFRDVLGVVRVFGTTRDVGLYDFNGQGSKPARRPNLFVQPNQPRRRKKLTPRSLSDAGAKPVEWSKQKGVLAIFQVLGQSSRELLRRVLDVLPSGPAFRFPGLLSLPTRSKVLLDVHSRPTGQIDYLLGGQAIRVIRVVDDRTTEDLLFLVGSDKSWQQQIWDLLGPPAPQAAVPAAPVPPLDPPGVRVRS
jgi:hypothetical protein